MKNVYATVMTMPERAPQDKKERAEALDISRSFIVRAPAGSGKTALLICRYLALLATVERPEEILAMTFTRKAAGEMRARVLDALRNAEESDVADEDDEYKKELHKLARAALARGREKNWGLPENAARLQFHTIHGFGAQLVRRLPFSSGFGAPPSVDDFPQAIYRQAAAETVAALEDYGDRPTADAVGVLLRHVDNNHGKLHDLLADALEHRDQWLPLMELGDAEGRKRLEESRRWVIAQVLQKVCDGMPQSEAQNILECARHAAQHWPGDSPLSALEKIPPATVDGVQQWYGIADLLLTKAGAYRRKVDKRCGFPPGNRPAKARMVALLEILADIAPHWEQALANVRKLPPAECSDGEWRVLVALLRVLRQTAVKLQLLFAARGACDFTELAVRATESLGASDNPTDLALALDYKIKHILVDEFQDTSHAQIKLLQLLTAGWDASESRTLFLVGDPQQSIYLFRDADVGIYLRAVEDKAIGQVPLEEITLRANFRSHPVLVEWFNKVFRTCMPPQPDSLFGAATHCDADAEREPHPEADVCVHARNKESSRSEAAAVVDIARKERAADPHASIAILARSRSHLPEILRALRDAKVPCREVNLDSLARRPVVQDLFALARALLHPADRAAWLALLRAPWCGLNLVDLATLTADKKTVLENMRDDSVLRKLPSEAKQRLSTLRAVLKDALKQRGRLPIAQWVENTWRALGGAALVDAQVYADARRFLVQLEAVCAPAGLRDYRELRERVDYLYSGIRAAEAETADEVQVMTMHGVKGLEFDVVLIPSLQRTPRPEMPRALLWNRLRDAGEGEGDAAKAEHILLAPLSATAGDSEPMVDFMRDFQARKMELERARLLYVACTRARRKLHLFASLTIKDGEQGVEVRSPPSLSLLACIWKAVEDNFIGALRQDATVTGHGAATTTVDTSSLIRLAPGWQLPAGPGAIPIAPAQHTEPEQPPYEWAGPAARAAGTLVHRVLCRIAEEGAERWDEARVRGCRALFESQLHGLGMDDKDAAQVWERVQTALLYTLSDERGRWIVNRAHQDAHSEYALSGMVDGRRKDVVVDRTFVDADGVRWIIDYKTGPHRGGAPDKFLDSEQERYAQQLQTYAELIAHLPGNTERKIMLGLYFPLARGWREWSPSTQASA